MFVREKPSDIQQHRAKVNQGESRSIKAGKGELKAEIFASAAWNH
jgi:hypothetical protein